MKKKLQSILNHWKKDELSDGEAVDDVVAVLEKGDASDIEIARYIVEDTSYEGDDYLTDYQCIEIVVNTYELEW